MSQPPDAAPRPLARIAVPTIPGPPRPVGWRLAAKTAHAYLVLPHAVPVLVVLATTAGFAILARDGPPPAGELARLLLAMLGGQLAIGAVNEVVDAELDAVARPAKPIPAGYVSVRAALWLTGVSLAGMIWFAAGFGAASLALCVLGTGAGLAYDLWAKRSFFSWLPYLVALPLLPIWVWVALVGFEARLLLLYPLGAFAVVGVHLSQALPDAGSDRAAGIRSLSSLLGERRAILACWAATLSAPVLALGFAPGLAERPEAVWVAAGVVVGLVGLDAALYAARRTLGVAACFPCVAVSTAAMGLGWVLAVR